MAAPSHCAVNCFHNWFADLLYFQVLSLMLENFGIVLWVYLSKISGSNMTMNIIKLESTPSRCDCTPFPKNKLQHALESRGCSLYWGDLFFSPHQSWPSVCKWVVQKAGVDNSCGRKRGELGKINKSPQLKIKTKNLESDVLMVESWSWYLKDHVVHIQLWASFMSYRLVD